VGGRVNFEGFLNWLVCVVGGSTIVHKKYAYFPYFMVFLKYGSTGENCPYFFRTSREKKSHLKFAWKWKRPVPSPAHFLVEMIEGACGGFNIPLGRIGNFFHIIQLQQTIQSRYTCGANQHLSLGLLNFRASLVFLTVD
jgi:hypothetical protein